jgi:hypothetical protein
VATVEAGGFALHKKAVLRKNDGIMRLDLLESGLFAASPQPFLVVYVDTALVIQSPIIKATEPLSRKCAPCCQATPGWTPCWRSTQPRSLPPAAWRLQTSPSPSTHITASGASLQQTKTHL